MKFTKILLFLVIVMFVTIPGFAQTGNIHGKVTDTDGKPMVGATISIDRQGITQHFEVKTDNRGQYLHAGLPTGQYQISVMRDGKKALTQPGVVRFGGDTAVDFDLKQAAAQGVSEEARQKAAEAFKKAIEYNPQMAQAYYQLGISYFGAPDTIPQAIPTLQKFQELVAALPKEQQTPFANDVEAAKQLIEAAKASAPTGFKSEKAIAEEKAAQEKAEKQNAAAENAKKKN